MRDLTKHEREVVEAAVERERAVGAWNALYDEGANWSVKEDQRRQSSMLKALKRFNRAVDLLIKARKRGKA